jgi:hypothetical protein
MCTACFRNKLSKLNPYSLFICSVWLSKWTSIYPNNPTPKSKMVTDLSSCEIEFAYYIWSWAEMNCHLQSKLILDSAFKGFCHLQESCFLVLHTYCSCVYQWIDWVVGESENQWDHGRYCVRKLAESLKLSRGIGGVIAVIWVIDLVE